MVNKKEEKEEKEKPMFCGVGDPPKGRERGTPEFCVQTNQVRYYGLVPIDKRLLITAKGKTSSLIKEQLKLRRLEDDAKLLVNNVKNVKLILSNDNAKPSKIKAAENKLKQLFLKRDKLVAQLSKQKTVVKNLESEAKEAIKALKAHKKSQKKAKKKVQKKIQKKTKSGSKTTKPHKNELQNLTHIYKPYNNRLTFYVGQYIF